MTVMLLAVVAVIFIHVVNGDGGLRRQIEIQGEQSISKIQSLQP